jgi:UrcA family protein
MRILMALIVAAGMAAPAAAAEPSQEQTRIVVKIADLDLSAPAGQRALDRRVRIAIGGLCGYPVTASRDETQALAACQADAMQSVAPQMQAVRQRLAMTVAANP